MAKSKVKWIGVDKFVRNISKEIKKIEGTSVRGLLMAALYVKGESQKQTPVVTSNLRNSAFVTAKGGRLIDAPSFKGEDSAKMKTRHTLVAIRQKILTDRARMPQTRVGYTASYAGYVHENPRAGKTKGISPRGVRYKPEKGSTRQMYSTVGNWKFLEKPLRDNKKKILDIIRRNVRIKK